MQVGTKTAKRAHFGGGGGKAVEKPRLVSLFSHPMGWVYWFPLFILETEVV
jgi:hypothetical protein